MSSQGTSVGTQAGQAGRGREAKLQALGMKAVSTLYMIVRNLRMYEPDNAIFAQPLEVFREVINTVVAYDRRFDLQAAGTMLALNGHMLRVDFSSLENLRHLTNEFKDRDIGGFYVERPVQLEDLKAFLQAFSAGRLADEDVQLSGSVPIKATKYRTIVAKLKEDANQAIEAGRKIDRKKYALTVYARAIYFMRRFLERVQSGGELPATTAAGRIIRDFVDLYRDQTDHFLGMTTTRRSEEYVVYHSVNTSLLSLVVGVELGLSREQLLDLGKAALFHDIGVVGADQSVMNKHGALSKEERERITKNPLFAAKILLKSRPLDLSALKCILAAHEAKLHFSRPHTDDAGKTKMVKTKGLGLTGRIIHVASCFDALTSPRPYRDAFSPQAALNIMRSQMAHEFDPDVLRAFVRVLGNHVVKNLGDGVTMEIA
jgi:HD-GYP domain-containing protein (c-di-GMP phosphodiesterase class II)